MESTNAAHVSIQNRQLTLASQLLMGIVTGVIADGELNSKEIVMLQTWISANEEVARSWPGSAVARQLREILADGVITADEQTHLLRSLQQLAGNDFAETGSVSAEVAGLPYDHEAPIIFRDATLCLTGEFLFGTRASCEKLCEKLGAATLPSVSRKVHYLVVGTHVSPQWVNTSYGRKIQKAMELRDDGHRIFIIPERRWMEHMSEFQ